MGTALVVGAGPSGLMAAWAAHNSGFRVTLFDPQGNPPDGRSAGVFYLHDRCDLQISCTTLLTTGAGSAAEYARKVYGEHYNGPTSFPAQSRFDVVWDGMEAMERLWELFLPRLNLVRIPTYAALLRECNNWDRVINTAPLDQYMPRRDELPYQTIYVSTRKAEMPYGPDRVFYDGTDSDVYRYSSVFGREACEWRLGYVPDPATELWNVHCVKKVKPSPIPSRMARRSNLLLTGRYGAWDKRMLTHSVYYHVREWLNG